MWDLRRCHVGWRTASALILWGAPQGARGQDVAAPEEEIVVTGSRTAERTTLDTPAPVDAFDETQLRAAGAVGSELGQSLATVAPSFFFPRQSNSGTSDHVRAGQLRGLSPDQLLVLVNGRRRHTSAIVHSETKIGRGTAAVDFNAIPLGAIERVEILRDAAGPQYGSDAIAGVVNLVLDDDPDSAVGAITVGTHLTHEGAIQRTLVDGETLTLEAEAGVHLRETGFLRFGLEGVVREATNRAGFDEVPFFYASSPTPTYGTGYAPLSDNLAFAGQRNYAMGDPRSRAGAAWLNGEIPFGNVVLYAFGTGTLRTTRGAAFFRYPDASYNVPEIYPSGYLPRTTGTSSDLSVSTGLRGEASEWDWDVGATWGRNVFRFGADHSLNASLGVESPTEFDSGRYRFDQISGDLVVVRSVDLGFTGPLVLALGAATRHELYATQAGQPESYEAGPEDLDIGAQGAPGITPNDERRISRGVYGAYGEVSSQLVEMWFLDLAGRYEYYTDFGGVTTGKAATLIAPMDGFGIRASVSNGFRAPGLSQLGFVDRSTNFGEDRALVSTVTAPVDSPIAGALGATPLKPERAFDVSAGLVVGPFSGLSLTVDAFRVVVDDRITLSERFFGPGVVDAIAGLPGAEGVDSVRYFTNAIDTRTLGIEGVLRFARPLGTGVLSMDAGASFFRTEILSFAETPEQLLQIDPSFALVGVEEINTVESAAPTNKQVVTGSWNDTRLGGTLRLSRFGGATRVFNFGGGFEPEQTYGDEIQLDAEITVRPSGTVELTLGASNLLDEYPDLSSADINYFGNLPYDVLSPVGINGRYLYLRSRLTF